MEEKALPVIPSDRMDDIQFMDREKEADLVVFMAGNQFMAMGELVFAFQNQHPDIRTICHETLPPGLELRQILAGGARFRDRILTGLPDLYTSVSPDAMKRLEQAGKIAPNSALPYLHNRLAILTPPGNPAGIKTVADLGKDTVRVSQPDPAMEDIGFHIINMYKDAGGDELAQRIMEKKRAEATTIYTKVHHRETPLRLELNTVDAGPVWATEAIHAEASGRKLHVIHPGPDLDQRNAVTYYAAVLADAPNPDNGRLFLDFLTSKTAGKIFSKHGFVPHP